MNKKQPSKPKCPALQNRILRNNFNLFNQRK